MSGKTPPGHHSGLVWEPAGLPGSTGEGSDCSQPLPELQWVERHQEKGQRGRTLDAQSSLVTWSRKRPIGKKQEARKGLRNWSTERTGEASTGSLEVAGALPRSRGSALRPQGLRMEVEAHAYRDINCAHDCCKGRQGFCIEPYWHVAFLKQLLL